MSSILVIGGTRFLGRAIVENALAAGHRVTMFNRGSRIVPELAAAEQITGDRKVDLGPLKGRSFDTVIDTCGYFPRDVAASTRLLADHCQTYVFISTISVYADFSKPGMTEDAALATTTDVDATEVTGENYGGLKVLCEQVAEAAMPGRVLQVRSGYIVGPHDPTDRFTYWVRRVARGGRLIAPGSPDAPVQFLDVRDTAAWSVAGAVSGLTGTFNVTGPAGRPITFGDVLNECRTAAKSDAEFTWFDDAAQERTGLVYGDLPLYSAGADAAGVHRISIARAVAAGLTSLPLRKTVADTLAWDLSRGVSDADFKAGIKQQREDELLLGTPIS